MKLGGVYRPSAERVRGWQNTVSYVRQAIETRIGKEPLVLARSAYREDPGHFATEFARLTETVGGPRAFLGREALIAGCGPSAEEGIIILDSFPTLARVHMVDWHPPHIDFLERTFAHWGQTDPTRDYRKIHLHLTDLAHLENIMTGSVSLVYARHLFETLLNINYNPHRQKTMDILREMNRVMADRAVMFLLDYESPLEVRRLLADLNIYRVKNQPDIWHKIIDFARR